MNYDGVTPNDGIDSDEGANFSLNFPEIGNATYNKKMKYSLFILLFNPSLEDFSIILTTTTTNNVTKADLVKQSII